MDLVVEFRRTFRPRSLVSDARGVSSENHLRCVSSSVPAAQRSVVMKLLMVSFVRLVLA